MDWSSRMDSPNLPNYGKPPVVEVVSGVMFDPIPGFKLPLVGKFWSEALLDFPVVDEQPPLAPVMEILGRGPGVMFIAEPAPVPRVWFTSRNKDQVIQVQRDRFLCNWRKVSPDHEYPRFRKVFEFFETKLASFEQFIRTDCNASPIPRQYELSYVNHLDSTPDGPIVLGDIGRLLPDLSWRKQGSRWLPDPEDLDLSLAFLLPKSAGRLRVRLQTGLRVPDQSSIMALEITARGLLEDRTKWFELAHEWIVKAFEDLVSPDMNAAWRKQ
jgi:uncharacterized protein (TIGR04255 family)